MQSAVLLDTCALLWLGLGVRELSFSALQTIEETETVFVSPISFWEITNKVHQKKLTLGIPPREWLARVCSRHALSILPLTPEILIRAGELPDIHRDPADRMIIASALEGGIPVITKDRNFPKYGVAVVS